MRTVSILHYPQEQLEAGRRGAGAAPWENVLREVVSGVQLGGGVSNITGHRVLHNLHHPREEILQPRTQVPKVAGLGAVCIRVRHHELPQVWTLLTNVVEMVFGNAALLIQPPARVLGDVQGQHLHLRSHRGPVTQSAQVLGFTDGIQTHRGQKGWHWRVFRHVGLARVLLMSLHTVIARVLRVHHQSAATPPHFAQQGRTVWRTQERRMY